MYEELLERIKEEKPDKERLIQLKNEFSTKHKLKGTPKDATLFMHADKDYEFFKKYLNLKPVRTISGVAPISVVTIPERCKHGVCTFCPGGPGSVFGDVPQSYTGREPAMRRAIRNKYDPYLQIMNRLEHYIVIGQVPQKTEIIIQGGTFASYDKNYQEEFVTFIYKAMNDFSEMFYNEELDMEKFKEFFELPGDINDIKRIENIHKKLLEKKGKSSLEVEQKRNEKSSIRDTVFCVETKPDWCFEEHINQMLRLGVTRVELGVQTIYDEILKYTNRGHTMKDTLKSIQLLKDSFLKVGFHVMPGLPRSDREKDINIFREFFSNSEFKPDSMKIYPCLVMKGTPLYELWKRGEFKPLKIEEAIDIISEGKNFVDKYCRIMRCQRDIPSNMIEDGVKKTNLRQSLNKVLQEKEIKCKCIRCREPGAREINWDGIKLLRYDYDSSGGREVFLSFEDVENDIMLGFIRLRKPGKAFRPEITDKTVGIREIKVYGAAAKLGEVGKVQHRGLGKRLLIEAERIAKEEFNADKILVMSSIGTKEYFRKLGYSEDGVYMGKLL